MMVRLVGVLWLSGLLASPAWGMPRIRSASDFVRQNGIVRFPHAAPPRRVNSRTTTPMRLEVGDQRLFWQWDLSHMPPGDIQVLATCRAIGEHVYVFVADDIWDSEVNQDSVEAVLNALESQTPEGSIHPDQGIVPNEIEVFGSIPDALDNDPRVYILLMELADYQGMGFDGYFNAFNQLPDSQAVIEFGYHSNEVEMITVNATIRPLSSDLTLSILAHEFQHLIHWGGDADEESWIDESCAEAAMVLNGYFTDVAWLRDYLDAPQDPEAHLIELQHVHYGTCLLFGSYLYERFGAGFLTALVSDPAHGLSGLENSLQAFGFDAAPDELFLDWATATLADPLGATEAGYMHPLLDYQMPDTVRSMHAYPASSTVRFQLPATCAAYIELESPDEAADLNLNLVVPTGRVLSRQVLVSASDQLSFADFDPEDAVVPFLSEPDLQKVYLVLWATAGTAVSVRLDIVNPTAPDEPDAGQADGGEDGQDGSVHADGDEPDGSTVDGGVDGADEATADAAVEADGEPAAEASDAVPDERPSSGSDESCGCASQRPSGLMLFGLGGLLLLSWRHRRRRAV